MKKIIAIISITLVLSGCSTIKKYWPRDHDPVMLSQLVTVDQEMDEINCKKPVWYHVVSAADHLDRYVTLREDPQQSNIHALNLHIKKMSENTNPTFCDLGKNLAKQRIKAAATAWRGR